jgi:hypothetical protein
MNLDPKTPITLQIDVTTTNVILGALSTLPYERVAGIIAAIQQQAAPQISSAPVPQTPEAPAAIPQD